ncbi:MAG TPA: NUDIX domain-containing protein [Gaiellaceae bacterium]|nr:NUDIX domain-containing protein [Gaiellaceae bacterium]
MDAVSRAPRGLEEVLIVVHRPGPEFLVLLRVPERGGYWHLVAGGVEQGETPEEAAARELAEEAGPLRSVELRPIPLRLGYEAPRGPIRLHPFSAQAPAGWEPVLNEEHVEYRWCSAAGAQRLLAYPEPRAALAWVARRLGAAT